MSLISASLPGDNFSADELLHEVMASFAPQSPKPMPKSRSSKYVETDDTVLSNDTIQELLSLRSASKNQATLSRQSYVSKAKRN